MKNDIVQRRFSDLLNAAKVIEESKREETQYRERVSPHEKRVSILDWNGLIQWRTSVLALLSRVFSQSDPTFLELQKVAGERVLYESRIYHFDRLFAIFLSAKEQYEGGYLFDVRDLVHAEVFSDELEQASHFLTEGYKVAAAVTTGVVLETTLRSLCETTDGIEAADKLNKMNEDLAKAGVYNKIHADQIRAWAKIRNAAAHGHPEEFDEGDVKRMIDGVRDFVAGQLG